MIVKRSIVYGSVSFIIFLAMLSFVYAENIACYSNSDCVSGFSGKEFCSNNDVYKNFINSSCINLGTENSYCSDVTIPILLPTGDCGNDEFGNWSSNYCSNNNVYHSRIGTLRGCRVINQLANISGCFSEFVTQEELVQNCANGCNEGHCINEVICNSNSDCGCNAFFGDSTCQNNNVFQNFITYICNNPGTINSSCSNSINLVLKQDCGENNCGNYGANYCSNNSVYHSRTCYDKGCSSGMCFNNSYPEETLAQTCSNGCSNGQCMNVICSNDFQCGGNGFSINKYCINNDVYSDYIEHKCINPGTFNSSCSVNISSRLFDRCNYDCEDGECHSKNTEKYPDYEFNDSSEQVYSYTGDVIIASPRLGDNQTIQEITPVIKIDNNTASKFSLSNLLWILIILVIILLILIIILVMMR